MPAVLPGLCTNSSLKWGMFTFLLPFFCFSVGKCHPLLCQVFTAKTNWTRKCFLLLLSCRSSVRLISTKMSEMTTASSDDFTAALILFYDRPFLSQQMIDLIHCFINIAKLSNNAGLGLFCAACSRQATSFETQRF